MRVRNRPRGLSRNAGQRLPGLKPGTANVRAPSLKTGVLAAQPVIQLAKIDHGTLTWADFQGKAPAKATYEAVTASDVHDPKIKDLAPKESTLKAVDSGEKCGEGDGEKPIYKVDITIDPSKIEVKSYMSQEESWAKAWVTGEKGREKRCKDEFVTPCETHFKNEYARIKTEAGEASKECKKSYDDTKKEAAESCQDQGDDCVTEAMKSWYFSMDFDGEEAKATTKDECSSTFSTRYQELSKKGLEWEGELAGETAKATSKEGCKSEFLPECKGRMMAAASAELLKHEQLHFDITEAKARETQAELRSTAAGFDKEVKACSEKEALALAKKTLKNNIAELDKIFKEKKKELSDRQDEYDRETNHGEIMEKQVEWKERVTGELEEP